MHFNWDNTVANKQKHEQEKTIDKNNEKERHEWLKHIDVTIVNLNTKKKQMHEYIEIMKVQINVKLLIDFSPMFLVWI